MLGLLEAYAHLFFLNLRLGGAFGKGVFVLASCGILGLAARGMIGDRQGGRGDTLFVLGAMAWMVPLWTFLLAQVSPRSGFTWHYILPSVAPMAVLAASGLKGRWSRWGLAACVLTALVLSVQNVRSRGTEDFSGAVEFIQTQWQTGDGVVCVEYQPPCFPTGRPWDRYAKQNKGVSSDRLETEGIHLVHPDTLGSYNRIWLVASALPGDVDLRRQLNDYGKVTGDWSFGWRPFVTLYEAKSR
jgi:hypothetical protein